VHTCSVTLAEDHPRTLERRGWALSHVFVTLELEVHRKMEVEFGGDPKPRVHVRRDTRVDRPRISE